MDEILRKVTPPMENQSRFFHADELILHITKTTESDQEAVTQSKLDVIAYINLLSSTLPQELVMNSLCFHINTAEYLMESLMKLYKSDNEGVKQAVSDYREKALSKVVDGIVKEVTDAMSSIYSIDWGNLDGVGDTSSYVKDVFDVLLRHLPTATHLLSDVSHQLLCYKLALSMMNKIRGLLLQMTNLGDMGAAQIHLDLHELKSILLQMPRLGTVPTSYKWPSRDYTKRVNSDMGELECIMKVCQSDKDKMIVTFMKLCSHDRLAVIFDLLEHSLLQRIMNMKGIPPLEQQKLLNGYHG